VSLALSPDQLRAARDEAGLTRQEVAAVLDCSLYAIQSWEKGWREPGANAVANMARLYGVLQESLFHEPDATADGDDPTNDAAAVPATLAESSP